MRFESGPGKNAKDLARRHVSLEEASQVWDDPDLLVLHARRRGEKRMLAIGRTYAAVFPVIHTRRGDAIRIISARLATSEERRTYERHGSD